MSRPLLLQAGAALNLNKATSGRLLDNLRGRVLREATALYAEVKAENAEFVASRPELAATMAGESRCLRVILHTIFKEMADQLG
jgi:serine/threonine-protein kinase HipA